jgi:Protein of unknown function (DUF2914)
MTAVRLPRPAALATVLVLLLIAIVAFPREIHGQVGGRVVTPDGVPPTASTVLVTVKGEGTPEATRPVVAGRFAFPTLARGTRVTVQAIAQGHISNTATVTAPDTMVVLILRPARAGQKFNIVPQGTARARTTEQAQAAPRPAADTADEPTPAQAPEAAPQPAPHPAAEPAPQQAPAQGSAQVRTQGTEAGASVNAQGLAVQEALFTSAELVDRAPAAVGGCTAAACATRYPSTVGTVTFWTRLSGGAPGRWVEHVWFHGNKEIARVRQKVEGPTWRTWTRKRIMPEWTGDWRVEVLAEDGTVLAERFFTIEK